MSPIRASRMVVCRSGLFRRPALNVLAGNRFSCDYHCVAAISARGQGPVKMIKHVGHAGLLEVVLKIDSPLMSNRTQGWVGNVIQVLQQEQFERVYGGLVDYHEARAFTRMLPRSEL